jgi:hypothetical protein
MGLPERGYLFWAQSVSKKQAAAGVGGEHPRVKGRPVFAGPPLIIPWTDARLTNALELFVSFEIPTSGDRAKGLASCFVGFSVGHLDLPSAHAHHLCRQRAGSIF